jgi:hypothetical protein
MTQDVDAIITLSQLPQLTDDAAFWNAIEQTNTLLSPKGLYITHLFCKDQIFLRPDWERHIVPILTPSTRFLKLFRPHAIDLILTKMMRGNDTQDMEDIDFLNRHGDITLQHMETAFQSARIPDVPELNDAFQRALPIVRQFLFRTSS